MTPGSEGKQTHRSPSQLDCLLGPFLSSRDTPITPIMGVLRKATKRTLFCVPAVLGVQGPTGPVANEAPAWFIVSCWGTTVVLQY